MGRHSSSSDRWTLARVLAALGATLALVGFVYSAVMMFINGGSLDTLLIAFLLAILGAFISILIMIQVDLIRSSKINIGLNWWILLIFACLQAIFIGYYQGGVIVDSLEGLVPLGLLLEVVAVIFLLIDALR